VKGTFALLALAAVTVAGCSSGVKLLKKAAPPAELAIGWKTDFSRHTVPFGEIQSGGPGKDGIPAIDHPQFLPPAKVRDLRPKEPVIELVLHGEARAYPLRILIWHEIVNDTVGGAPVAVTFCPLCNTAIAFVRRVGGKTLDFGTTGNLRNSDLVMYDRQTESWWQQFGGEGIVGRYTGTTLGQPAAFLQTGLNASTGNPLGPGTVATPGADEATSCARPVPSAGLPLKGL